MNPLIKQLYLLVAEGKEISIIKVLSWYNQAIKSQQQFFGSFLTNYVIILLLLIFMDITNLYKYYGTEKNSEGITRSSEGSTS
jgi:hypothetical protein